MSEPEGLE